MAVARVDGRASFARRAGEVQPVGSTEESRGWKSAEAGRGPAEQFVIHRAPLPETARAIALELIAQQVKAVRVHDALAQFAVKHGDDFQLAEEQAADVCMAPDKRGDARGVRLGEIEFRDLAGVEINHRPSRISEMIRVLSEPPESFA